MNRKVKFAGICVGMLGLTAATVYAVIKERKMRSLCQMAINQLEEVSKNYGGFIKDYEELLNDYEELLNICYEDDDNESFEPV